MKGCGAMKGRIIGFDVLSISVAITILSLFWLLWCSDCIPLNIAALILAIIACFRLATAPSERTTGLLDRHPLMNCLLLIVVNILLIILQLI